MLFLNKETGLKWGITDKEHIKILLKDDNYEVVEEDNRHSNVQVEESSNVEKVEKTIDYEILSYKKLQNLAKERGLEKVQVKKDELIKYLKEGE